MVRVPVRGWAGDVMVVVIIVIVMMRVRFLGWEWIEPAVGGAPQRVRDDRSHPKRNKPQRPRQHLGNGELVHDHGLSSQRFAELLATSAC